MKIQRFDWGGGDPRALAGEIRSLQPPLGAVTDDVAEIVAAVESEGDPAVKRFEQSFGGVAAESLRVPDEELRSAPEQIPDDVAEALGVAIANVRAVAEGEGSSEPRSAPSRGAAVAYREVSVAAAGAYVPGGAAAYPSTAVMCCVPARVAGVERIAVATPPDKKGKVSPLVLAAAALAGATEVYAMGGAQAIAALGIGTETVAPVDVVVGPGNRYVQEAKRQLVGRVGIDGIAGPSELMVLVDGSAELGWIALDLCAQAEHADDGLLVACSADAAVLAELEEEVQRVADQNSVQDAPLAVVTVPSAEAAVDLANAIAPEHLELACEGADVLAQMVRYAGCVFTGPGGATAFGDYAAGTNHVLPTGGAGRFQGPLGPTAFVRRIPTVQISEDAARELAPTVATLARAEGFPVHAESAEARAEGDR